MAYADQQMSSNRIIALILVALIHIGVGYVLVTGLAYEAIQKAVERVTTVDVDEPEPEPEEEPPPPPEEVPETVPPPFVPPPQMNLNREAPKRETTEKPPENTEVDRRPTTKQCADGTVVGIDAQCGPPTKRCPDGTIVPQNAACPEPPPRFTPKDPAPRNNRNRWVTVDDYRTSWINRDYTGTVSFRVTVGTNGRVSDCSVTGGTAPGALKNATCRLIKRRARFNAATNGDGNKVTGTYSSTVRWQIPE